MDVLFIVLGILVVLVLYVIAIYNGFVRLRVRVNGAWSDIEVQMKRRYNLIPNLIETVKGYASHEAGTLEKLTQARVSALANEGAPGQQAQTENLLTGALKSVFAVAEAYPDLNSPLKKALLTGFHSTAKHNATKAVSPSSETMRTI